jgi:uncharacterized protein
VPLTIERLLDMKTDANYYVYAYFDPRNYEMLYVGKGKGSRKNAHWPNKVGTAKERQIHEIERAGQKPLIKVVAANLTEEHAFLVEKALIWRTGESLTNVSGGHYADNFRPPNTLHLSLPGFDTEYGIFFVNVGAHFGPHRQWEDCYKYNFLAAGYGREHSAQLDRLSVGDIVAAYFKKKGYKNGYVGVGRVVAPSVPVADFRFNGHALSRRMLKGPDLLHDAEDADQCEYLVKVKWIKKVPPGNAQFRKRAGLFVARQIVARLQQPKTQQFLERQFGVDFKKLLDSD